MINHIRASETNGGFAAHNQDNGVPNPLLSNERRGSGLFFCSKGFA
jgi:hypothetical protein